MPKTPRNNFYPELPRGGTRNAVSGIVDVPGYHILPSQGRTSTWKGNLEKPSVNGRNSKFRMNLFCCHVLVKNANNKIQTTA